MTSSQINDLIALVIGAVLPICISWLKRSTWTPKQRLLCALAVCALAGALQVLVPVFVAGAPLSWQTVASNFALIFTAATASYRFWFRDTSLNATFDKKVTG